MKARTWFLVLAAVAILSGESSCGMSPPRGRLSLDGRLNCPTMSHNGGRAYLQLTLVTPDVRERERKPVNLSVVLDRSGSMADQGKIGNAKAALQALIDQLNEGDVFSLVIYDDVVEVLRPACRVESKSALRHLVDGIAPRGWTNLGGGMSEGFVQAEKYASRAYVNRVVLLSDGLANQGITDPYTLGRIAREHRDHAISLSTMGVGLEYNENLMTHLADQGGGNYYFIESSRNLASILRKEFDLMGCVVAQNAIIQLKLGRGVRLVDVVGCGFSGGEGRASIPLGDLYANDRRELTLELQVPEGTGEMMVASGEVTFDPIGDLAVRSGSFSTGISYTTNAAEVDRHRDMEIQAKADVAVSTRSVEKAMAALDAGKDQEAQKELSAARDALKGSPAAAQAASGAVLADQERKLSGYQKALADSSGDAKRMKKVIQYENYKQQKNK